MNCRVFRNHIELRLTAGLAPEDAARLDEHCSHCTECRNYDQDLRGDESLLVGLVRSFDERLLTLESRIIREAFAASEEALPEGSSQPEFGTETDAPAVPMQPEQVQSLSWWQRALQFRLVRYAAAAVIAGTVLFGLQKLWEPHTGSVAWAQVITRVVEAQDFICRWHMESSVLDEGPVEGVRYKFQDQGTRDDQYQQGRLRMRSYWVPSSLEEFNVYLDDQAYMITRHTPEEFQFRSMQSDAQEMVKLFKTNPYSELGTRRIDGIPTEGIELENPDFAQGAFDSARFRLYVDPGTGWPVRLESYFRADQGRMWVNITFYDFQWNALMSPRDVEPAIPDGFRLAFVVERPVADEDHAIVGLAGLAEINRGRYPSSISWGSAAGQAIRNIRRYVRDGTDRVRALEQLMQIRSTIEFYVMLGNEHRDPAYHGDRVTPRDFDKVLMRWRLDDGQYRIIYGDLRVETVSAERLAALEGNR